MESMTQNDCIYVKDNDEEGKHPGQGLWVPKEELLICLPLLKSLPLFFAIWLGAGCWGCGVGKYWIQDESWEGWVHLPALPFTFYMTSGKTLPWPGTQVSLHPSRSRTG